MLNSFAKYRKVYGHLWASYGRNGLYRLSFGLQIIKNALKFIVLPILLSQVLVALADSRFDDAMRSALLFGLFSGIIGVASPFVKYIGMIGENVIYRHETKQYFGKLLAADIDYFNDNLSGYLTTATRQYVDSGVQLVRAIRDNYAQTVMAFVFPVIVIAFVNIYLGIAVFILSLTQLIYMLWASYKLENLRRKSREVYKKHSGYMADVISNILAVKSVAAEKRIVNVIADNATKEAGIFRQRYTLRAKLTGGREVVTVTTYTLLLVFLVYSAQHGNVSLQGAILVATYVTPILTAIYQMSEAIDEHDDLIDKLLPAFDILDRSNFVRDPNKSRQLENIRGDISFDEVSFAYGDNKRNRVFDNFNLSVPAGQRLGVVGLSGAGKSTLTKLLLRFNDVDAGVVTIDDIDVRDVDQTILRQHIAYVPQEPLLFHASIRDNVMISKPDATRAEVVAALKAAHAADFIADLPLGLDSVVGERGVKLSGGQKQRIAIARAVLQETPIIILDEATSALDSESEAIIKKSFKDILSGKTAIVVAHRLSTLSDMDRIVVIEHGKIVEDGSHDELLMHDGIYAKLWRRQQRLEKLS